MSTVVKTLCYAFLVIALIASIALIVYGIDGIVNEEGTGFFAIIGLIAPFVAVISVYPMFALANIDDNVQTLNDKVENIVEKMDKLEKKSAIQTTNKSQPNCNLNSMENKTQQNHPIMSKYATDMETIEFINKRYLINIEIDDNIEVIKHKVSNIIADENSSGATLKAKVNNADSMEEIKLIFNMHKTIYS